MSSTERELPHPSHHSGPGYASAPPPPELRFDDDLSERFVHWLNYVPEAHRTPVAGAGESVEAQIQHHVASCRKHPFLALFTAHRHLGDASPEVRLQALLLASEALWWLHHLEDARTAAAAALQAHPESRQASWRLTVALYKLGRFEEAERQLDTLLEGVNTFAPAWSLRAQTKVWRSPDNPREAASDFEAAHELDATWPVPVRLSTADFTKLVNRSLQAFAAGTHEGFQEPPVDVEPLPSRELVGRGGDPDMRGSFFNPREIVPVNPLGLLGGDFASGARQDIIPGARFVLYQRNIENLCGDPAVLEAEVTNSVAEAFSGALRVDVTPLAAAPEVHAEEADMPAAGAE